VRKKTMFRIFSKPSEIPLKSFSREEILNSYYIDLHKYLVISGHYERVVYDREGIPMFRYNPPLGIRYSPTAVALHALVHYQRKEYGKFLRYVKWLVLNAYISGRCALLYFDFPFPPRAYSSHWVSGMTQGLAASVMARAFIYSNNEVYKILAEKFTKGMLIPIQNGGPFLVSGNDLWIEEYPLERPPKHVLNGFIFSILGIRDVYLITEERDYHDLFLRCTATLRRNMHLFDLGLWSRYDASVIAPPHYHFLNTLLVYVIGLLVNAEDLLATARRWMVGYRALGKVAGVALGNIAFKACLRRLLSALRLI